MQDIVTRCGYRCNLCLAYKENIHSEQDRQRVSDGWFRYYGFRIPPEKICCDGCLTSDDECPNLIDTECPVRPCVIEKGLLNCAYCDEYVCEKLKQRIVDPNAVVRKFKESVPEDDYQSFIEPYDNRKVLDNIRDELDQEACAHKPS